MNPASTSAVSRRLRTVFLDRDGVINKKMPEGEYVRSTAEFQVLAGVPEAILRLNRAGIRVLVVSNQRGIALGHYTPADVHAIHASLQELLARYGARIDGFYFCPHDRDECSCRKPLPGMFEEAAREFTDITAESSVMIGDSLSDIEFGRRLGMETIFLEGLAEHRKPGAEKAAALADRKYVSLCEAVDALLNAGPGSLKI